VGSEFVRVAKGKQLPQEWQPGQPLNVGELAQAQLQTTVCPFGPQCFSCRKGQQWDAAHGKHIGKRLGSKATPRTSRLRGRRR
jgi:hypothetical protein